MQSRADGESGHRTFTLGRFERRKEILRELAEGKIAPDDAAALLENER